MVQIEDTIWCDGCGVEITWVPVVVKQAHFCCQDCAKGLECDCAPKPETEDERREGTAPSAAIPLV